MSKEFFRMQKLAGLVNENFEGKPEELYDENLANRIADIIHTEVYIRNVPYSMEDGAQELDPDSIEIAAKKIAQMLNK